MEINSVDALHGGILGHSLVSRQVVPSFWPQKPTNNRSLNYNYPASVAMSEELCFTYAHSGGFGDNCSPPDRVQVVTEQCSMQPDSHFASRENNSEYVDLHFAVQEEFVNKE